MFMYYLKNKIDGEIVDVLAMSLENAQKTASENLGGQPEDYIERF
jgi:hypothetical protein